MGKPVTKTPHVVESNVTWIDIRSCACKGKQNGRQVHRYDCHSISVASHRGCFTKTPRYKSSDCSDEVICRYSWPIRYCLEKSNQTHTHTNTPNYCNPVAHVRRGLITVVYLSDWLLPCPVKHARICTEALFLEGVLPHASPCPLRGRSSRLEGAGESIQNQLTPNATSFWVSVKSKQGRAVHAL